LEDLGGWLTGGADPLGPSVTVRGGGKAAVTVAEVAARAGHRVTLVSESAVLAPELGLPGRFRLVHDARAAGADLRVGSTDAPEADTVLTIAPGGPNEPPALEGIPIWCIGDASGTVGLAAGLRAAADLATTI
jgi:NADPH-dependent 2,4-dienoyl-CoA reductase/sulfur reductase-like enzyme